MKFIITFGSNQLPELHNKLNPMKVMIVIEAKDEREARNIAFDSFVGRNFCTSYPYEPFAKKFADDYGMVEYSLKELEGIKNG